MLENYRWLPAWAIPRYQALIPRLEKMPMVSRFGVSVFLVARKP